jgi:hypothetical protein
MGTRPPPHRPGSLLGLLAMLAMLAGQRQERTRKRHNDNLHI